jgi:uncharacterized OB-fold protein
LRLHPTPVLTADSRFYWEGAGRGQLLIQACGSCGHLCHPPSPLCPICHRADRITQEMSGLGQVASFIIVHHPPNPWFELPIVVAKIELDEGPTVTSNVWDIPVDQIDLGLPVEVFFEETEEPGIGVPVFRPVGGQ